MVTRWCLAVLGGCLGFALLVFGPLTRSDSLGVPGVQRGLETPAFASRADYDSAWEDHLRVVDEALQEGRISVAVRAWHDAYGAALGSRGWEGMVAVGDALLGISKVSGTPDDARAKARAAYVTALNRARGARSVDGVLRTAEAFAALGDRSVVQQCLGVADALGANDAEASHRVREFKERWTATPDDGPMLAQEK
jgi:hypothetical protein